MMLARMGHANSRQEALLHIYTCPLLLGPDGGSRTSRRGLTAAWPVVGAH